MRLTPLDIRKQEFPRRFRGYEPEEVHTFLDLIAEDVEALIADRSQLANRVQTLEAQLNEFREIDRSLRDALVLAERMAKESNETARTRGEAIVKEAEIKALDTVGQAESKGRGIVAEAENRRRSLLLELEALESQRSYALAKFRQLLDDQRAVLDAHSGPRFGMAAGASAGPGKVVAMPQPAASPTPAEG